MSTQKKQRILVLDDEPDVTELLHYNLELEGYSVQVLNDPAKFVSSVREFKPDLIILDVMMPDLNGLQLCGVVRSDPATKKIPIIFVSARSEIDDRICGLERGADDYITKPFSVRELQIRISNVFKRAGRGDGQPDNERIEIDGLVIDEGLHELTVDGKPVVMTATEFRLLKLLMERRGRVQTREHLLVNVWRYDADIETRTVDTHIRRVREKLGPYAHLIETVRGVGYRIANPS